MILTLAKQVLIMFLLAGVGFAMFKTKKITPEGSKTIGNILIFLSLPCVIINSFLIDRTRETLIALGLSALAAAVVLALAILVSRIFFKKDPIAAFSASFSNPGFFGVPLIVGSLSSGAVFYVAAFIAFLNLLQWTYGVAIMTGEKKGLKPMAVLKAPFMIAILIGLFFFLTGLKMPSMIGSVISTIAAVNTPLAMFTVGIYLAQANGLQMIKRGRLYLISAVRLLLIPLVTWAALRFFIPDPELLMTMVIIAGCPSAVLITVLSVQYGRDAVFAAEGTLQNTALSLVTIPLLVWLLG